MIDYSDIYVKRILGLANEGITINKLAIRFNMILSEFLDFDELNDCPFDDDDSDLWIDKQHNRFFGCAVNFIFWFFAIYLISSGRDRSWL